MDNWYTIRNAAEVASPTILIYPDRVQENIQRLIADVGDVNMLRPHVKTHKLPQIVQMKLDAGITRFKVATIAEAEMTAAVGAPDVLLAYQPVGPNIARFIRLIQQFPGTRFSAIVDCPAIIVAMGEAASAAGVHADLLIDLDVGMHRTGIAPGDDAHDLYRLIGTTTGVAPDGLHAYDGHLHDADSNQLNANANAAFALVAAFRDRLLADGLPVPQIVVGGTPTSAIHAQHGHVEVGAGTTILWDAGQPTISPDLHYLNAAVLLSRVISKPGNDLLCLDLGHKSVASEMQHPRVRLLGLEDAEPVVHSEEHLTIRTPKANQYDVGSVVYGFPWHICPTMALHGFVWAVKDGIASECWPVIARERRITI